MSAAQYARVSPLSSQDPVTRLAPDASIPEQNYLADGNQRTSVKNERNSAPPQPTWIPGQNLFVQFDGGGDKTGAPVQAGTYPIGLSRFQKPLGCQQHGSTFHSVPLCRYSSCDERVLFGTETAASADQTQPSSVDCNYER
jgi:hypothetical protein